MAGLITTIELRSKFPFIFHKDVLDEQLNLSLFSASRRLKSWVSAEDYEEANQLPDESDSEELIEKRAILKNAEGHLALHFLLLGLNTNLSNKGLIKTENVEGNVTNSYFDPEKVDGFTKLYLELAREIAEPFSIADGTPGVPFEVVNG